MSFLDRFKRGEMSLSRIEAFSDGVFAIVVTLLVLELKVPELKNPNDANELVGLLIGQLPKFFSWLISFIIVAKFWLNHHELLRKARHANYGMVWLNSIFLMFQSFVPFPTAMMGEYKGNPMAVSLFGVVMAINTLLFMALQSYILRNLIKPELAGTEDPHAVRNGFIGPALYLLGAGAAWAYLPAAFVVYGLTPLFYIVPPAAVRAAARRSKTQP
jgi:uncharacterized membrane protein